MDGSVEDRIARLEARLLDAEDRLAILNLMANYGPAADSGSGDVVETLFTEDGTYGAFEGAAGVREMIETLPLHRSLMQQGCAHLTLMPFIRIYGDRATALCYSQIVHYENDAYGLFVTSANRWEFERTPEGWKIASRVNRVIKDAAEAQQLQRETLFEPAP